MKLLLRANYFTLLVILFLSSKSFGQCNAKYATVPYTQNFEAWINLCNTLDAPDSSWINAPSTGDNSWRRDDQGGTANWGVPTAGTYSPTAKIGNHSARFHSEYAQSGSTGTLDLYLNCSTQTGIKQLSFYYIYEGSNAYMDVYLSTDGGNTFGPSLGHYTSSSSWTQYSIPIVSNSATTVISFVATSDDGCCDIGLDDVQMLPPCTGKPVAGNIISALGCPGPGYSLSLPTATVAGGISYNWQQSSGNSNWSTISGDTMPTSIVEPLTPTYYRVIVTCSNSGLSDTTPMLEIKPSLFRKIPYSQNFESWINRCDTLDVPDSGWINNPSSGDSSWRRDDEGNTAGWGCTGCGTYSPASSTGSHSARFHSSWSSFGSTGTLNLYLNCSTDTNAKYLFFDYNNMDGDCYMNVYLSTDFGATFNQVGNTYGFTPNGWTQYAIPITSDSAATVISFVATSDDGGSDIGLDNVQVQFTCVGKPAAGQVAITQSCNPPGDTLSLIGSSANIGLSYSWQQSIDSTTWFSIAGDTSSSVNIAPQANTYYRAIVTCKGSGLSDTTPGVEVGVTFFYRNIPYTQNFESWMNHCSILDVPDSGWINNPASGAAWRRDDEGATAGGWVLTQELYSPSSAVGIHSARYPAIFNGNTGNLDLYINCSIDTGTKQLSFYYIDGDPLQANSLSIQLSTDNGATFTTLSQYATNNGWTQYLLPIVSDSAKTIIRFSATGGGYSDIGLDYVQILDECKDKPVAGSVTINPLSCTGVGDSLSLSGTTLSGNLSYYWQQSADNANWSNLTEDTFPAIIVTPITPTYYRAIVTCKGSGLSDTTSSANVSVAGLASFYRNIPYTQDFESWINRCNTLDVPDTGWTNNPSYGDASWRREDQGDSAGWNYSTYGLYTPSSAIGNHSARFHASANELFPSTGTMDLYLNCSTVSGSKTLSFYYNDMTYPNSMSIYLSTDGGSTFTNIGTYGQNNGWQQYSLPINSNSATTVVRFAASGYYQSPDIGLDYVQVFSPCAGKPVAGNINVYSVNCPTIKDSLSLTGTTVAGGLSYSWQQSTDNTTWNAIIGDTLAYIIASPFAPTYYRAIVICAGSGLSDTTLVMKVKGLGSFYRNIPYTQSFESWINHCDSLDAPDTGWANTPLNGDASWRRDDQGASAEWSNASNAYEYSPVSAVGNHSARFQAEYTSNTGTLDVYVNCSSDTGAKQLSFYYIYQGQYGSAYMNVYISLDGGITFTQIGNTYGYTPVWTQYTIPIMSDSAETIIRFAATGDNGGNAIGLDYVQVLPPCSGKPVAGNIVSSSNCSGAGDLLSLSGSTAAIGISYNWQQSIDNINWSVISGDTTSSISVTPFTSTYYRAILNCINSGSSDTTAYVKLNGFGAFYRNIPYTQDFESWINRCDSLDVPDTGWINNPSSGISSWRRDDQGPYAGWEGLAGAYSPSAAVGNHSAKFDAYNAPSSNPGTLDLYVNCSANTGIKGLSFYYIYKEGNAYMDVYLSKDGGNTFSPSLGHYTISPAWTQYSLPIPSDSAHTIIRFVATGDNGSNDIGLDYVQVEDPCQGKPTAGIVSADPGAICASGTSVLSLAGLIGGGGLTFQWQFSQDGTSWSNVVGDSGSVITTPPISSNLYYRSIVTCPNSSLSDTSKSLYLVNFPACYCPPQTTGESGDNIGNVTIKYDSTLLLNNGIDSPAINSNLMYGGQQYINNSGSVINLNRGLTYTISTSAITDAIGGNYFDTAYAFIDYNQDGMWEPQERIFSAPYNLPFSNTPVPISGTFTVPLNADTGYTMMRIQLSYEAAVNTPCYNGNDNTSGETEDFIVHILPPAPCLGVPSSGNTVPALDSLCSGTSVNFYLINSSIASGLTYQWQSSPDNSTWSSISGAVNNQYNASGLSSNTYYRCQVTCTGSGQSSYSSSSFVYITGTPANPITANDTICGPGNALLSSKGGSGNYYWFTSSADSLPVFSGSVFSPYVPKNKTYYVSSGTLGSEYCTTGFDSLSAHSFNYPGCSTYDSIGQLSSIDTGLAGLIFNAQAEFNLTGIYIFPQYSGSFHIYLLDSSGNILNTAIATITNPLFPHPYWVSLNFNVPAGKGYQLVARISEVNCMANSDTRLSFPFNDCNNVAITAGTKDGIKNETYYFFYKWVINYGCESQRVPVSVYIKTPPALSIIASPNNGYSCGGSAFNGTLTANGSNYTLFSWSPVTGLNTSLGKTVTLTGIDSGITYSLMASNGTCNNIATKTITIEPPITIQTSLNSNYNCVGVPVHIASVVIQPQITYCLPSIAGDCNDYISNFNFGTVSLSDTTCPGYVYYNDTAFVQAGTTYTISITPSQNTNPYGFGVWIDYNQNGAFTDSSELAFSVPAQSFSGSQTITGSITIPQNASHGNTRMRVISFLNNTPVLNSSNCGLDTLEGSQVTNIGTIQDFNVDITNNNNLSYKWSPSNGLSNTSILSPIASSAVSTTYALTVTDSISGCSAIDSVHVYVYPNPAVTIYVPMDTLCLGTSEVIDAGAGFVSYHWSNGDTTQTIPVNSSGNYRVQVTGYNGCIGSDSVNISTRSCTGINPVISKYSIEVYPNPFDDQFTLELDDLPEGQFILDMTNILGQKVLEFNDNNTAGVYRRTVDLHGLPSGMYNISIELNGQNYIKQIIKTN